MTLEKKCGHEVLIHLGFQEGVGVMGNCYDCHSTRKITKDYENVGDGVYRLNSKDTKANKEVKR